jgi:hypothetical protein
LGEAIDNFNSYLWGENDPEKLISTENMFFWKLVAVQFGLHKNIGVNILEASFLL